MISINKLYLGMATTKKYTVLKFMTKRNHGMKSYEVDSAIELTNDEAAPLIKHGFVKEKRAPKANRK